MLEGLLSALPDPSAGTAALDSSDCSYYSCDHSADYVGSDSNGADNNLTHDGVIYPTYTPFGGAAEPGTTQLWGLEIDHTGDYIGTPPEPLTGDGTSCVLCVVSPHHAVPRRVCLTVRPVLLTDVVPACGAGVIYPAYDPSYADAGNSTSQLYGLDIDHTGDYIGSDGSLLGDGVIYPAQEGAAPGTTSQLYGLDIDHTGDYIGSDGSLLGDGVIYPAQEGAAPGTTVSLYEGADHSGAYYCTEPEADCSTEVVDPVLKPIEYPLGVTMALAAPVPTAAVGPAPKKGDKEAPARPGPAHLMLMGPALIFGAAEATAKLFDPANKGSGSWVADFKAESCKAADAVTPVGGFLLKKGIAQEA
jgi:hypothetical protein